MVDCLLINARVDSNIDIIILYIKQVTHLVAYYIGQKYLQYAFIRKQILRVLN